jgi:hypothetical protein
MSAVCTAPCRPRPRASSAFREPGRDGRVVDGLDRRLDLLAPWPVSEEELLDEWRAAVADLRGTVTPDDDGDNSGPNYGSSFNAADYSAIPRRDLPFGAPTFLGDDA